MIYRDVPLNNFRVLTSEVFDKNFGRRFHYHAHLANIDLAAEDNRPLNGVLLETVKAVQKFEQPAHALAALLLQTAELVHQYFIGAAATETTAQS